MKKAELLNQLYKFYTKDKRAELKKLNKDQLHLLLYICNKQNEHQTN